MIYQLQKPPAFSKKKVGYFNLQSIVFELKANWKLMGFVELNFSNANK